MLTITKMIWLLKEKGMKVATAARLYNVKRITLINHAKGEKCGKYGRPTVLSHDEESVIAHGLCKFADWGFGIDRECLRDIVKDFLTSMGKDVSQVFTGSRPGYDWMLGFEKRWKDVIPRRVGQPLPANRAYACNKTVVDDFFQKLGTILERLGTQHKPQNIFNCDETRF